MGDQDLGVRAGASQRRLHELCRVVVIALAADGAATSLFAAGGASLVTATDEVSDLLEQTQQSLGEGPSHSAFRSQTPFAAPDLHSPLVQARWPAFAHAVEALAVGWYLALPMSVGGIHLGVLSVYSARAGPIPHHVLPTALLAADAAALAMLDAEAESPGAVPMSEIGPTLDYRVHQATGMVMAQTGGDAHDALSRMRARAFGVNIPLQRLADDVISREIRFEEEVTG